jgi:hypothetical protein
MPQVLTMTPKPDEAPEQFAARIADQMTAFFKAAGASTDEAATDVPAEQAVPEEEPAPSA